MATPFLFDANAVSDIMLDLPKVRARLATVSGTLHTSAIVLGEILYGIERLPAGKRKRDLSAKATSVLGLLIIEPVTPAVADQYANLRWACESRGHNLHDNDLWIAATALVVGAIVVTRDADFMQMPGLQLEHWTK